MINNNNLAITLHRTLELSTNIKNNNQNSSTIDNYIEIPKNIKNFEQLLSCEYFTEIKQQYIDYINQIVDLYNYFTELDTDDIAQLNKDNIIKSSINNMQFYEKNGYYSKYDTLFYSYNNIRKALYNIINYLSKCKNEVVINNEAAIACSELRDCFDICLEGFNSKVVIMNDYIEYISSNDFEYKIKCKLKNLIQNKIKEMIITKKQVIYIHSQTSLFNLLAADYGFDPIVDGYANLYDYKIYEADKIIKKIKSSVSQFDVCTEIVNELYDLFKELLIETNKEHWLNNNIIEDFTYEDTTRLEIFFIDPINKYLTISDSQEQLSIRDIICEQQESYQIYLADIRDVLHYLIAKNLNKFADIIPNFKEITNIIAVIESNLAIINVNNCYFYILKDNQEKLPLQLQHIQNTNMLEINTTIYVAIFIQALKQTQSIEDIYKFLNSTNINELFFNNKDLIVELNNSIKDNKHLKEKLISAILYRQINYNNTKNDRCFEKNILTIDILNDLLESRIDVVFYFLSLLTLNDLYGYISTLTYNNIKKIIKQLKYQQVNFSLQEAFYLLFKNHKWQLLEAILTSELKFTFFNYLTKTKQLTALEILLNNSKENISNYFLLDYITLDIKDNNKNNILHIIVNNNDIGLLLEITKQIPSSFLDVLLLSKNNDGFTPLMLAVANNNINLVEILMPYCNLKILGAKDNDGFTPLMLAVAKNNIDLVEILMPYCNLKILGIQNKKGCNALMLAIINKNLLCFQELAKTATTEILTAVNKDGNTAIIIAAKLGIHDCLIDLLKVATPKMLIKANNFGYNTLMYAIYENNILSAQAIIETANSKVLTDILKQKSNDTGRNAIMIASREGFFKCLSLLLEQLTEKTVNILLETDSSGDSALSNAISHGNKDCFSSIVKKIEQFKNLIDVTKYENTYKRALILTIQKNYFECSDILLQYATTKILAATDDNGYNSLMLATARNNEFIISKILEKANSDIQLQKSKKFADTAITIATKNRYVSCLKLLLERATPEAVTTANIHGNDCLMLAFIYYNYNCVQMIIDKLNVITFRQNTRGNNAIMLATIEGAELSLQRLLASSITTKILATTNHEGYNCLMIAIKYRNHQCMLDILEKANYEMFQQKNNEGDNALELAKKYHNPYYNEIVAKQNYLIELKNNY